MKESTFIQRNREDWERYEKHLKGGKQLQTDEAVRLYLKITSDLSWARSFYPKRRLVNYLNQLSSDSHSRVSKFKRYDQNALATFVKHDLPTALREGMPSIKLSLVIFLLFCIAGFFSASADAEFVRLILGDRYVEMTLYNVEQGDPMGIYASMESLGMSAYIGFNNIYVAIKVFALGILACLGTVYALMVNGIMVGAFLQMFAGLDLFGVAFSTIMLHGTLELWAIVVAGGAGIELGKSWLFPGTYTRLHSLKKGAIRAVYIMVGLIPLFVLAAGTEGFVTRQYQSLGPIFRWSIIFLSVLLIYLNYAVYPKKYTYE